MTRNLLSISSFLLDNYVVINFVVSFVVIAIIVLTILQKKHLDYSNKEFETVNVTKEILIGFIPNLVFSIVILFVFAVAIGYRPYIITSGSMRPSIEPGAVVLIKKVSLNDLEEGDVITFSPSGTENVTHQIIAIRKNGLTFTEGEYITYTFNGEEYTFQITGNNVGKTIITHGTANSIQSIDAGITIQNVKGKVCYCVWYVGLIFFTVRKQLFAFILLVFTLYFAYRNYYKYPKYQYE